MTIFLMLSSIVVSLAFWIAASKIFFYDSEAEVTSLDEGTKRVAHRFYDVEYVFPIIEFKYSTGEGDKFNSIGVKEAERTMMTEKNSMGNDVCASEFIWRNLEVGQTIPIKINRLHSAFVSVPTFYSKRYSSQLRVYKLLSFFMTISALIGLILSLV